MNGSPKKNESTGAEFQRFTEAGVGKHLAARAAALRTVRDYFRLRKVTAAKSKRPCASQALD